MSVPQLDPPTVAERLETEEDAVYLDVRTEEEFAEAHPSGALNVPIFQRDGTTGQPVFNDDFLPVVEALLDRDAPIYVGCASGQRSLQAATMMRQHGFEEVANVATGFSGKKDVFGQVVEKGWLQHELPVESGEGEERAYRNLRERSSRADREG